MLSTFNRPEMKLLFGTAALLFTTAAGQTPPRVPAADATIGPVLESAAAYVTAYQQALTYILADEIYVQEIRAQTPPDPAMPRRRTLQSTAFFVFAPDGREWMAVREVKRVDGRAVENRHDVRTWLQSAAPRVDSALKSGNAQFNIGRTFRNFNEPTLSLLVLDAFRRPNFKFQQVRATTSGADRLVTVAFEERPSNNPLIRDLRLEPTLSKGHLTIAAGTGEVRDASLDVAIGELHAHLETIYARDERLNLMVPTIFRERYQRGVEPASIAGRAPLPAAGAYEDISCEARYTNYRRFEATARIK